MIKNSSILSLFLLLLISVVLISWDGQIAYDYSQTASVNADSVSPGWRDGPHVVWINNNWLKSTYYIYNSKNGKLIKKSKFSRHSENEFFMEGRFEIEPTYYIEKNPGISEYEYRAVEDIFVVGDVHGEYDKLISLLNKSGIINEKLEWQFGKGQLVFMGDIFDKGQMVTECLWFIKNLEQQAERAGGKIHKIIGNHEIMNLNRIFLYNPKKYDVLQMVYPSDFDVLYDKNTELGRWIRTWNAIIKIDDKLFVHGGISPHFFDMEMKEEEINSLTRKFLNRELHYEDTIKMNFLLESYGPSLYRGYLTDDVEYPLITEPEIDRILEYFGVNHIIFGHTEKKYFRILYDKKLMGIDVPLRFRGKSEQALHFSGDEIFKVYSDGTKVKL